MLNARHALLLFSLAIAGCQTANESQGTSLGTVPQSWLDGPNYRCMRAHHLGQILPNRNHQIVEECQDPAGKDWAPAQTALALALPLNTQINRSDQANELLRKAVAAGEPLAMSIYGAEIRGDEGRRLVKRSAELGVIKGAAYLHIATSGRYETQQDDEDAYWVSYILEQSLSQPFRGTRSQYESGRHVLSSEVRQRLKDDAMSIHLGEAAATPVSPQINSEIKFAFLDKNKMRNSSAYHMHEHLEKRANQTNRNFARILTEDPMVAEELRVYFTSKAPE